MSRPTRKALLLLFYLGHLFPHASLYRLTRKYEYTSQLLRLLHDTVTTVTAVLSSLKTCKHTVSFRDHNHTVDDQLAWTKFHPIWFNVVETSRFGVDLIISGLICGRFHTWRLHIQGDHFGISLIPKLAALEVHPAQSRRGARSTHSHGTPTMLHNGASDPRTRTMKMLALFGIVLCFFTGIISYSCGQLITNETEARMFLEEHNIRRMAALNFAIEASWNYNTNLTDYNHQVSVGIKRR